MHLDTRVSLPVFRHIHAKLILFFHNHASSKNPKLVTTSCHTSLHLVTPCHTLLHQGYYTLLHLLSQLVALIDKHSHINQSSWLNHAVSASLLIFNPRM